MIAESLVEELERRVRTVEEELVGERHVSRFVVEQTTRNSEVLHALRAEVAQLRADVAAARVDVNGTGMRVDVLAGDGAAIKAALAMHGRALDVLQQDIRQLRGDMTEVRGEMTELRGGMTEVRGEITELRGGMTEVRGEITELRGGMTEVRGEITELRGEMTELRGEMNRRLSAIEQTVAAILAAVSPRDPA